MTNNLFSDFNDRSRGFVERVSQFNETLFHQFSRAAEIQMEALRRYADIANEQVHKLSEVRNLEDVRRLSEAQVKALKEINEQLSSDWQTWQDYLVEARDQLKSSIVRNQEDGQPSQPAPEASNGRDSAA